jgi:hypothetical protein
MQQIPEKRFAPRWVILIYIVSLLEAIGLAVHFGARVTDPEMASMQPLYTDTQESASKLVTQPGCADCGAIPHSPQHAAVKREYVIHDDGRHREIR